MSNKCSDNECSDNEFDFYKLHIRFVYMADVKMIEKWGYVVS